METLLALLKDAERITIVAHLNPDGDAVGSVLGLYWALESLGKQVTPVLHDPVPKVFTRYLTGWEEIKPEWPEQTDLCILLDASSGNRTGFEQEFGDLKKLVVIDHHPLAELAKRADCYIHNLEASSTAELLLGVLQQLGIKITPVIATCLLTGLYTDTGGFQHPNTTEQALECAAELLRRGGKLQAIRTAFDQDKSLAGLRLLGLALERANSYHQNFCTISCILHDDFETLGASDEDVPGIISQLNNLPHNRFSLLVSEFEPGKIRGNLRGNSSSRFNVSRLARLLGGGGHAKASGFSFPGHLIKKNSHWQIAARE